MLARLLTPDHGFPLRLIAPGIAGGRQIKWLSHITVSSTPTTNKYHINENKRFPESMERSAAEEGGYFDPSNDRAYSFVVVEDCVNSSILVPDHDEVVLQQDSSRSSAEADGGANGVSSDAQLVTVKGYAYTGGWVGKVVPGGCQKRHK